MTQKINANDSEVADDALPSHHEFGPSTLKHIEICPGYRSSNETNPMAEEGTMLHDKVEKEDLSDITDEQRLLVKKCLDYTKPFRDKADFIVKEQKTKINLRSYKDNV